MQRGQVRATAPIKHAAAHTGWGSRPYQACGGSRRQGWKPLPGMWRLTELGAEGKAAQQDKTKLQRLSMRQQKAE
eukprot:7976202-Alexandrium_andersonii.AAC.1